MLEWDAESYDALPLPHTRWGAALIAQLPVTGSETVLELGCGTGRDTATLLPHLPTGRVIAIDGSTRMLDAFRERLGGDPRVRTIHADLREPFGLDQSVDLAFSVATLHWVTDHSAVFAHVADALRPGGRFLAECGGAGNIAAVRSAIESIDGPDALDPWNFASIEETRDALLRSGFTDVRVDLVPDPAALENAAQLEAYLATVVLGAHLRERPVSEHHDFVRAVANQLTEAVIDYVRLQIRATRA